MITYIEGGIFQSKCQTLVNPVNTKGAMGKGLALMFKQRYPHMNDEYVRACWHHDITVKKPWLWRAQDHWVLCFATKTDWHDPSKLEYIALGLEWLVANYQSLGITSIAFPKLGCGLGQLDWREVKEIMEIYLADLPIDVEIYI